MDFYGKTAPIHKDEAQPDAHIRAEKGMLSPYMPDESYGK